MPNIKSAKKRVKIINKRTEINKENRSKCNTAIKKFEMAIENGNKEEIENNFKNATKIVDQTCAKGVLKKNTASRKKASLAKKYNAAIAK